MSGKLSFAKSTEKDGVTPQALYIDTGATGNIAEDLKKRGCKRLLILSNKSTFEYRSVDNVIKKYNDAGLRTFKYQRRNIVADSRDIEGALKTYKEYNCDTIVVIGDMHDISVAKMTAVSATNPNKPSAFAGIGSIKYDIGTLVAVKIDSAASASTPEASFFDFETGKWITCVSQIMMPQIVVIDSEMMRRVNDDMIRFSALDALCIAIEAYLSPYASDNPEYRANAEIGMYKIFGRLNNLVADTTDGYLLTKVSMGGFYAGLSATKLGFGYTHFIMHELQDRFGCEYGAGMGRILVAVLRELLEFVSEDLAECAKRQQLCNTSLDTISAAQMFIESVSDIFKKNMPDNDLPFLNREDCANIAESVRKSLVELGYKPRLSADRIASLLMMM